MRALVMAAAAVLLLAQDKPVQEKYDSGKVKEEYRVDDKGLKHGPYAAYYESGRKRLTGSYDHGKQDGTWDEFADTGRQLFRRKYAKGTLAELIALDEKGAPLFHIAVAGGTATLRPPGAKTGEPAYPRSRDDVRKRVSELAGRAFDGSSPYEEEASTSAPFKAGKLKAAYLADALGYLNAYRWLCDVSSDVQLDPENAELAQHGATIMAALKERTHNPRKPPGMDDAFFQKAFLAVSKGNVASGPNVRGAIDYYLYDSDGGIKNVGHRLYLLNPGMKKIAFGQADEYVCYWPTNAAETKKPELMRYPAAGWFPAEYLWTNSAWSATVNAGRYKIGDRKDLKVRAWLLGADYDLQQELKVDSLNVSGQTVIFRPKFDGITMKGSRVLVSIAGVADSKAAGAPLAYIVDLFGLTD